MSSSRIFEALGGKKLNLNQLAQSPGQTSEATQKYIALINTETISPPINEAVFSYENIASKPILTEKDGEYHSGWKGNDTYISFALLEVDKTTPQRRPYREHGLKIHISLDDTIEGNIANGWNAIVGILKHYHVARTKVIQTGGSIAEDAYQEAYTRGKQITIYASMNADGNWANILCAITQALLEKGIKPGYRPSPSSSKAVEGNCYLSYRYDFNPTTQEYRPARNMDGAFPSGIEDPLEKQYRMAGLTILTPSEIPKPPTNTQKLESSPCTTINTMPNSENNISPSYRHN